MDFLIALFLAGVYIVLSIAYITSVAVKFPEKPYRTAIAIVLVILLPTWDMVLGAIIYFPSCLFFPKVAIYETAETDGIYYKGEHDYVWELEKHGRNEPVSERTVVGHIDDVFKRGYTYVESRVTKRGKYGERRSISPVLYRCVPLPRDPDRPAFQRTSCVVVDQPKSLYTVKETVLSLGTAGISIKKIYNRSTGKLMAKYRLVSMGYVFPFFAWLGWHGSQGGGVCRPVQKSDGQMGIGYTGFEYHVLKPKK